MEINKAYDASQIERKWYKFWEDGGYFKATKDPSRKPFTLLIPPPNVTGILHMGHVLNNTLQDVVVRYHRMLGEPTLWLPGVDHAGIATQNVVEKQLAKEGLSRHQIGREKLIELIWNWKNEKGNIIIEQLKLLGASCDWERQRFTMDEMLSRAVKEVFVTLYEQGLIYKGKYIINWCPRCVTALANDEVEHEDESGSLWQIRYPYAEGDGFVTVATTRPETMLGDVAVAVNPKDKRYTHLLGKELILPLTGRTIPVIADDYVDMSFGTGCVKVTPAHDPNDFEIGLRHDLPQLLVLDEHGVMNAAAGQDFEGLDRYACRKLILAKLEEQGLLEETKNHEHAVGHCYRCDTVIEPYLSDQWFVKMKPLAEQAIAVVESGEVKFQPERWTKVYMHWMNNIRDWCISRQIWWGHRIPAYYCLSCNQMQVSKEMPSSCPNCSGTQFRQDEDVLDTWFSSWLWPFSTMGWPDETDDLQYFLPTNVLITAPEIIYLWVARMIMSTLHFRGVIPFDTVLLHGTVRDEQGRKMSKSLGNSPDPIDIIEKVGADALRFSMIFNTPKGEDTTYTESLLETGRNFVTKIWNAWRLISTNVSTIDSIYYRTPVYIIDKWIYSRLHETIEQVTKYYNNLQLNDAAQCLYKFFWDDFCSYYIEASKPKLRLGQKYVAYYALDIMQNCMRLLHPITPFVTEEIWQSIKNIESDFYNCYKSRPNKHGYCDSKSEFSNPSKSLPKSKRMILQSEVALIKASFPQFKESMVDYVSNQFIESQREVISTILRLKKTAQQASYKTIPSIVKIPSLDSLMLRDYGLLKQIEQQLSALYPLNNSLDYDNRILQTINFVANSIQIVSGSMKPTIDNIQKINDQMDTLSKSIFGQSSNDMMKTASKILREYSSTISTVSKSNVSLLSESYSGYRSFVSEITGSGEITIPLDDVIDPEAEKARLSKQIEKLEKELSAIQNKLSNENFIAHAKAEVISKEREKQEEVGTKLSLTKDLLKDLLS